MIPGRQKLKGIGVVRVKLIVVYCWLGLSIIYARFFLPRDAMLARYMLPSTRPAASPHAGSVADDDRRRQTPASKTVLAQ